MRVHPLRRRLQRRQPVPVVQRVPQLQVHHRRPAVRRPRDPHRAPIDRIVPRLGPARPARNHLHPVGPQRPQLVRHPIAVAVARRLHVRVARHLQRPVQRLHQLRPRLLGIGPPDQLRQRMGVVPRPVHEHRERRGRRSLGDHPHAAISHRIPLKPLARQAGVVVRRPPGPSDAGERHHRPGPARLRLGRSRLRPLAERPSHRNHRNLPETWILPRKEGRT